MPEFEPVVCAGVLVCWLLGGVELSLALQPESKLTHNTTASEVIMRMVEEKELKEPDGIYRVGCHMLERSSVRNLKENS